jgi:peptidoglycan hydrolase CwlO-like protein
MIRKIGFGIIPVAIILLALISGCSDNRERVVAEEKEEYITKVESMLMEIDGKIADLRMQAAEATEEGAEATEETAQEIQYQIDQLNKVREELYMYLDNLRETTADNWQSFRNELDERLADVRKSIGEDESITG